MRVHVNFYFTKKVKNFINIKVKNVISNLLNINNNNVPGNFLILFGFYERSAWIAFHGSRFYWMENLPGTPLPSRSKKAYKNKRLCRQR